MWHCVGNMIIYCEGKSYFNALLVLPLILQQCWAKPNLNNFEGKVNFKDQHLSHLQLNNEPSRTQREAFIDNQEEDDLETRFNNQQFDPSKDPNIIFVPRLGLVRGHKKFDIINNRQISAYLGLKYASVKPGLGRFQKASPLLSVEDIIDATKEPPNCPQFPELDGIKERENRYENVDDCLTLNIFTPEKPGSYPVLIFVHGEMLFDGSATEGQPNYFMENDIVLATINYRLAPFGYLSTLTDDMPGNIALSDLQMALEWIKQFIKYFNGNPDQVTLMGQSGGATLIHALSISGKADGLFHRLILQSGTALNPYFIDEQPISTLRSFSRYARCPPGRTPEDIANCFEHMSTSDLLYYFKKFMENNEFRGLQFLNGFKLIVGDKLDYLPRHPASMIANNTKPLIVGTTKDAGAFILSRFYDQLVQLRSQNISDYINVVLKHTTQPKYYSLWKNWALKHIFTAEDVRNPSVNVLVQKLLELINLILFRGPIIDSIRFTYKNHSTFMYCFDYRGEYHRFGHLKNPLPFEIDATLSDDNIFLFPYPQEVSHLNTEDKSMSKIMISMWINFATYGVPNLDMAIWPNASSEYGPFVRFTSSQENKIELDYHFGEGIPVPSLYPEYFNTTKVNATLAKTNAVSTLSSKSDITPTRNPPSPSYLNYQ